MKKHEIIFIRKTHYQVELMTVVSFESWEESERKSICILQDAVTQWIDKTQEGSDLYEETCEDLNIGDLAGYVVSPHTFDAYGVYNFQMKAMDVEGDLSNYDCHLYLGDK